MTRHNDFPKVEVEELVEWVEPSHLALLERVVPEAVVFLIVWFLH